MQLLQDRQQDMLDSRERRPDIFAMAIGIEVCTACREKAHREGGWASDSVAD
jgi:hypothetical protein